jgi:hypothetical protein
MAGVFDFIFGESTGEKARRETAQSSRNLAEQRFALDQKKFEAEQAATQRGVSKQQFERLQSVLDESNLTPQAREDINRRLSESPLLKGFQREGESLFSFAEPTQTSAEQKATATSQLSAEEQKKVFFPGLTPEAPPTEQESLDEIQDIQDAVANGNLGELAAKSQIAVVVNRNPDVFKNADIGALTALPKLKLAASVGGVDPAFFEKGVKSEIEKDIKKGLETVNGLVGILEGFDRDFLTVQGKFKGKLERLGDVFDRPDMFGGKEFAARQSSFVTKAKGQFLVFRKFITGVAGGIQEFKEIGKAFPEADQDFFKGDTPDEFKAKTIAAIESGMRAVNLMKMMRNEGLEITQENVTAMVGRLPIENIPIDIPAGATVDDILKNQTVKESLSSRINAIKASGKKGNATVANAPSERTQPQELSDQLQFSDISKQLPAGTLEPFMTSHPRSLQRIQQLIKEEQMEIGDIAPFLEKIKNMSDEEVIMATGGQ